MNIQLPTKKGQPNTNPTLEFNQLVVIGANGAGKTRFGSNIESRYSQNTHRISAQKSLSFPKEVRPKSLETATEEFWYGSTHNDKRMYAESWYKKNNRWGQNPNTSLLNDYEKLLVLLHTEEYESLTKAKQQGTVSPETNIDKVKRIWEIVLPHRKLKIRAGVIESYPTGFPNVVYNAHELSDGERVIFYLIGEVICAPENSILIIDEPEMHLHKSLIKSLFDLVENERRDCTFIYLTHDIDFAFTRQNAKKIWAKSYEGNDIWDYEILAEDSPIPEQLFLEVLGSRRPIIFLEGDNSSIDYELYEQVYDDKTLKPVGSCDKVVQVVKAFREQQGFHHIESFGIIDRDRRQIADIVALNRNGIWVLDVAEAENLLLIKPIIKAVANHMGKIADDVFSRVRQNIINFFAAQINNQILLHYKEILRREYLSLSNFTSSNIVNVMTEIDARFAGIDKQAIFNTIDAEFRDILARQDFDAVLRVFNLKNALIPNSQVCELTGIRNKHEYKNAAVTLLKRKDQVSNAIKSGIDNKIIKNAT